VSPFGEARPVQSSYFFATTPAKANTHRVVLFRDWLLAESAADALPLQVLAADRPHLVAVS
jgi:hypothetical protein